MPFDLQGKGILPSQSPLPDLPGNAQYVFHDNLCFDWGTFGWALSSTVHDVGSYKYIVFMNSSTRGPHLPAYWPVCFPCYVAVADVGSRPGMQLSCVLFSDGLRPTACPACFTLTRCFTSCCCDIVVSGCQSSNMAHAYRDAQNKPAWQDKTSATHTPSICWNM